MHARTLATVFARPALVTPGGPAPKSAKRTVALTDTFLVETYARLWHSGDSHNGQSLLTQERAYQALDTWPGRDHVAESIDAEATIEALVREDLACWRVTKVAGAFGERLHLAWTPEDVRAYLGGRTALAA